MVQRELSEIRRCPSCGRELKQDQSTLHCSEHGAFFAYGPQLLVRAPEHDDVTKRTQMPWEQQARRAE